MSGNGLFYESFDVGTTFTTAGRTLYNSDIINFTNVVGIHEEIYTNVEYIEKESIFGRPFAPGPLTFCLSEGLVVQRGNFDRTGMALLEATMTMERPWFVGETIVVTVRVVGKRESKSKLDRGIVTFVHEVDTTAGERVMTLNKTRMIRRLAPTGVDA